jgi:hypothetical protein
MRSANVALPTVPVVDVFASDILIDGEGVRDDSADEVTLPDADFNELDGGLGADFFGFFLSPDGRFDPSRDYVVEQAALDDAGFAEVDCADPFSSLFALSLLQLV